MLKIELKHACNMNAEMYDLVRVECSSLYIALDFVGSEFPMAFGYLHLLKPSAINSSYFFFPLLPSLTLNYVSVSQVNLNGNIEMDGSYNTK